MESGYVLLACDRDLSAPITNMTTQRAFAAPGADWRVRRFDYGSWRDPYRNCS